MKERLRLGLTKSLEGVVETNFFFTQLRSLGEFLVDFILNGSEFSLGFLKLDSEFSPMTRQSCEFSSQGLWSSSRLKDI